MRDGQLREHVMPKHGPEPHRAVTRDTIYHTDFTGGVMLFALSLCRYWAEDVAAGNWRLHTGTIVKQPGDSPNNPATYKVCIASCTCEPI